MPVIKTIESEECTTYIYNDCMVKSEEERKKMLSHVSQIIMEFYKNREKAVQLLGTE
ncbi:hypothetical protein AALA00_09230 [Lachnospiraceae bacterium 46-15]